MLEHCMFNIHKKRQFHEYAVLHLHIGYYAKVSLDFIGYKCSIILQSKKKVIPFFTTAGRY